MDKPWVPLTSPEELDLVLTSSNHQPIVIFKHSTRCNISALVMHRLENQWQNDKSIYFVDLLKNRDISNAISERLDVIHESPQILVVKNGECIFDESHLDIQVEEVLSYLN